MVGVVVVVVVMVVVGLGVWVADVGGGSGMLAPPVCHASGRPRGPSCVACATRFAGLNKVLFVVFNDEQSPSLTLQIAEDAYIPAGPSALLNGIWTRSQGL